MSTISIEMDTALAMGLAMAKGWTPTIEDTTQEMIGDEYPTIPNPQTYEEFLAEFIPEYIKEYMLIEGRKQVIVGFTSKKNSIDDMVNRGVFDTMILAGNMEGINEAVKSSL